MASPLHPLLFYFFFFFSSSSHKILSQAATPPTSGQQNTTHLHFYFHDVVVGTSSAGNTSTVQIIQSPSNILGLTSIIDDPLTETEDPTSPEVGRAQGTYSVISQSEIALLMDMNFVFTAGEWKGSGLSILGRNPVMNKVREMPVLGGTGKFRLSFGYALANTIVFDQETGNAVVEYNVYVKHH